MKSHLSVLAFALLLVVPFAGNLEAADKDVRVINTAAEAVPVTVQGTAVVAGNVTVTGKVGIASDAVQPFQVSAISTQVGNNVSTVTVATVPQANGWSSNGFR